jgi:hypothetical protein
MISSQDIQSFRDRVGSHPGALAITERVLDVAKRFSERKTAISLSPTLTSLGKTQALQDALPTFLKELCQAQRPLKKIIGDLKARRLAALEIPEADRSDTATAIQDAEIRSWFSSLDLSQRESVALTTTDARILRAIVNLPAVAGLSGSLARLVDEVRQRHAEMTKGEEIAAIGAEEAIAAEVSAAAAVARGSIQTASGVPAHTFDILIKPIEEQHAAPWLVKNGDRPPMVCEVGADGLASYRPASRDEIADGIYFPDAKAYAEAKVPA